MAQSKTERDPFGARTTFRGPMGQIGFYSLNRLQEQGIAEVSALPFSIRILLEAALRHCDGYVVTAEDVENLARWDAAKPAEVEIPFMPARVVLQDFTGVPAIVDLAAMRVGMKALKGNPRKINPLIPVDLVIDHSVQVDWYGQADSLQKNVDIEFRRNKERYEFLRWGQQAFDNFRVVPPNTGIVHQVNLEYLAQCAYVRHDADGPVALPDTLVGTDSHTTMINGLGVLGWGVGGIEAEAAMLGQPLYMLLPEVVGMELKGRLPPGATATDLVLRVTEILRKEGVVGKFVEFFGEGMDVMSLADRATIANMAPEYGATMGYFPVDEETLRYLRRTGRSQAVVALVESYYRAQGLFRTNDDPDLDYTKVVRLDMSTIEPSLAGPKRPQDRVPLKNVKPSFAHALSAPVSERGFGLAPDQLSALGTIHNLHTPQHGDAAADSLSGGALGSAAVKSRSTNGSSTEIGHGAVVIAAITSCTNTSNPSVMLGAGLLAKRAVERGLTSKPYVKTSLAPGSRVVTDYLESAGVLEPLAKLGFYVVGYGCTTCIGNSGPLPDAVADAIKNGNLVAAAVLSGNRNFEGRVNPFTRANYLASPPLVVAYALAGTMDIDFEKEPIGTGSDGQDVYLKDIWPTNEDIQNTIESAVLPEMFTKQYESAFTGNERWNAIETTTGDLYQWDANSTYIQLPPFLEGISAEPKTVKAIEGAHCLAVFGDSVTTDHISPAGSIAQNSPAGKYLMDHGVEPVDFNSYGARRGNDRVMVRGTFANIRIRNEMVSGTEGGVTRHLPSGEMMSIYDAAMRYRHEDRPLIILAGAEYGTGSSRDWAAKGTLLLGIRAVIAVSYERIHRSNLVGMGVLPLQFQDGENHRSLLLTGEEIYTIGGSDQVLKPRGDITVLALSPSGKRTEFKALVRIDTPVELDYYHGGGILPSVLRKLASSE